MRKLSFFMLIACLLATTAFVFATSPRFINQGLIVDDGSGGFKQISNAASPSGLNLSTSPTGPTMQLTSPSGTPRDVYFYNGTSNLSVTSDGTW